MSVALSWPRRERSQPKHRASDKVRELSHQMDGARDYIKRLLRQLVEADQHVTWYFAEVRQTAGQLGVAVVEAMEFEARALVAERQRGDDYEELVALRQFKANVCSVSTLPAHGGGEPDDQETEPVQHVGDDFPDDYLDQMRQGWGPKPVGPAVLEVRLDEPTAEHRFPATARITDPARLLSRMLADAGPSVTVGSDGRTG
jgi:hypothetical protein